MGESALYGREGLSLGEQGCGENGTQDKGLNRQRLEA